MQASSFAYAYVASVITNSKNDCVHSAFFTVAFFLRACTHGIVYNLLTFTNEIANGIKG